MFERLKRLWELSASPQLGEFSKHTNERPKAKISDILTIEKMTKATFIPRITKDPAKEIVNEIPQ